jgi:hypothetical protein
MKLRAGPRPSCEAPCGARSLESRPRAIGTAAEQGVHKELGGRGVIELEFGLGSG